MYNLTSPPETDAPFSVAHLVGVVASVVVWMVMVTPAAVAVTVAEPRALTVDESQAVTVDELKAQTVDESQALTVDEL